MSKKAKVSRILCLLLAAVMVTGYMTGCANTSNTESQASGSSATESAADSSDKEDSKTEDSKTEDSKTEESSTGDGDATPTAEVVDLPAAVFSVDVPCVEAPDEGAEVTQVLKLTSSSAIDGTVKADDITLGGSFEGMKVSNVSNDAEKITLTVSGVPKFEGATTIGYVGTMDIAGSYFGSDKTVEARVPVMCKSGEAAEGSYFYPFFDAVIDNDTVMEMHIFLRPYGGTFKDLTEDKITLDGILKDAEIVSVKKAENEEYELVLNVKAETYANAENTYGTITLAKGSMSNNDEEVSYTREYSVETVGRKYRNQKFSQEQLDQFKELLKPKKDKSFLETEFPTIGTLYNLGTSVYGYYGTAMTAYKTIYSMLGAFGIIEIAPSAEEKRHQEIMEALGTISDQISAMQEDVDVIRQYAVDNKRALEDLSQMEAENYLAQFHTHFDAMVKYTNEIENALKLHSNDIIALAEAHYVEDEEGKEMTEAEMNQIIKDFGKEIVAMDQTNYNTIATKLTLLDEEYTKAMTYLKQKNSNPITRYCQVYQYLDNFSTTDLVDKEAYALDLDLQFDRTLSYLMLLGGKDSQTENIKMFEEAYFPDVVAEATNANGDPYCYITKSYVRLSNMGEESGKVYDQLLNRKQKKVNIMPVEDFQEFADRMDERTLKEELLLAGFTEEQLREKAYFKDDEYASNKKGSIEHFGLAYEFQCWGCNYGEKKADTPGYYRKKTYDLDDLIGENTRTVNKFDGTYDRNNIPTSYLPSLIQDGSSRQNSVTAVGYGLAWGDTEIDGRPVVCAANITFTNKNDGAYTAYKGKSLYFPMFYLVSV